MCLGGLHFVRPSFMRQPGIIFDLDGTLVDSVYQHAAAGHDTFRNSGITAAQWRFHRAIGMSGKLFLPKLLRDEGLPHSRALIGRLESGHSKRFTRPIRDIAPRPGAANLLKQLKRRSIPFAIATSGNGRQTRRVLRRVVGLPECPVITADDLAAGKPAHLFERTAK
jgi:beta-phosphoglucomutase-like phosphatase (HAD superfamily)